ncbi:MAG: hypothetical protein IKK29_02725 [Christensenellaceae bacterium]|nr:hypothetical protein [Christensenellaceae bacterium]
MDFRKKMKIRLFLAIGYIVLGLAMIVAFNLFKPIIRFCPLSDSRLS